MQMPKPGPTHEKLRTFVGEWTLDETMHPSPWDAKGGKARGRSTYRMDLDGFFLICDYHQERDGRTTYKAHGVFGWDSHAARYMMHWFDSMGMDPGPPAPGVWEGDMLTFQHIRGPGHFRYTYRVIDRDHYTFRLEVSGDGTAWTPFAEAAATRVR